MLAGQNISPDPVVVPYAPEAGSAPVWWEGLTEPCPCFPKAGTGCRPAQPPWWGAAGVGHSPVASSLKGARPGQRAGGGAGPTPAGFLASLWRA